MTVSVRPRSGGWLVDIRFRWPDGARYRDRIQAPVDAKSAALRWGQAREAELLRGGRAALLPPPPPPKVLSFAELWCRVLQDHYRANRKKPSTIEAAETAYRIHLGPLLGKKSIDAIGVADIAALKGALSHLRPKTVNNVLSVLSRCLRCAVEWELLVRRPKVGLLAAAATESAFYEVDEYRRLVEAARRTSSGHLVLVLLAGSAGLRRGEIRALKWTDLDMARKVVKVRRGIWRAEEGTTKGGRERPVPMTAELHAALVKHRHLAGERVLYSAKGRELSNRTVRNWLGTVLRRAGLPVATTPEGKNRRDIGAIHRLRHTFCSHLAAAGVPAKAIQELAGHADLKTTMRYMHLAPGDRDGAMATLSGYYAGDVSTARAVRTG
jgi:integrase